MQAICQLQRLARAAEKLWDGLILHAVIAMGALVQKKMAYGCGCVSPRRLPDRDRHMTSALHGGRLARRGTVRSESTGCFIRPGFAHPEL
jgi:hypothetical protein